MSIGSTVEFNQKTAMKTISPLRFTLAGVAILLLLIAPAFARQAIRDTFFAAYPNAIGTPLDKVQNTAHCLVCHYKASGAGPRTPYGDAIKDTGFTLTGGSDVGRSNAIWAVRLLDSDGDGFTNLVEITDTINYGNTPTFPGFSTANSNLITELDPSLIAGYLTPAVGGDTTPPVVQVLVPNGGETFVANRFTNITWTASDASGIASVNIFVSLDDGATYQQIARNLGNSGVFAWVPADRPTTEARIKVVATDPYGNSGFDVSNDDFTVVSPPFTNVHGVPTTLRDFDMPGTQPFEHGPELAASASCASCHGGYDQAVEPHFNWQGSMMANASRDLLFQANMVIANQDAPNSGDLCLRCHLPRGWLGGRSVPTDGSRMVHADGDGVSCALCHSMVDPVYVVGVSPTEDQAVLAGLSFPGTEYGNGMYVIDPSGTMRGPYSDAVLGHPSLGSPFARSAAFCGTCHDVSNPAFQNDGAGNYVANTLDLAATNFSPHFLAPVERTYSEWLHSEYASPEGVYAPQFAGNRPGGRVSTCQHCHMRYASGYAANTNINPGIPLRTDMAVHDLTGGSTWMSGMLTNLYPGEVNHAAIEAGIARSIELLNNAATLAVADASGQFKVTVTNECGHKLPTGYPEGRRVWLNVKFYNDADVLLGESGAYDFNTGELTHDLEAKIYEVHPGLETNLANALGLDPGPSLHFVLNNRIYDDNRIPPRGFTNAAFAMFGGDPKGYHYDDGQYWDDTLYTRPAGSTKAVVRLYYQSTSKKFIEFLRDNNRTDDTGQKLYDIWSTNGMCPPTLMAELVWMPIFELQRVGFTPQGHFRAGFRSRPDVTYTIEYTDSLEGTPQWHEFVQNGSVTAEDTTSSLEDDFTTNTSGGPSTTGARFYRFKYNGVP
jgi:hypothetical protein